VSILKPEMSIVAGLATATLVYGIYRNALPTVADIRVAPKADHDVEAAERSAAWFAGAIVGAVSLLAKDATIFVIGGGMVVGMSWWYRHADAVDPVAGVASMVGRGMAREEMSADTTYEAREAI
jgi:predicted NBD/HSP70 family sugar kinase